MKLVKRPKDRSLKKYDPNKGLRRIAAAEAAEKHWRRTKNAENLIKATVAKLTEQREFVLWWDASRFNKPGPNKDRDRPVTISGDAWRKALSRWRSRMADAARFEKTIESETAKCVRFCEGKGSSHVGEATGEIEWYTPREYIDAAVKVMGGIDLDPASSDKANETVGAASYYTIEDSGLDHDWQGRVWMNPPYATALVTKFAEHLVENHKAKRVPEAIVLVNNATETYWFGNMIRISSAVVFPQGRISFIDKDGEPSGAPLQGQAVLYIGSKHVNRFLTHFSKFGWCARLCR
jgi:phage N-6-adenine-methyltransferase